MRSKGARGYYFFDADHVNIIAPLELKAERLSFLYVRSRCADYLVSAARASQIIPRAR
ncbi:hypothetical protein [Paraburkholderia azotifigens]|uniref:Uncharacterized protein n=1 Tax=Paraburkholderia azotifigens TaxID=2057004 RepID=A0ABU9R4H6_9BURK|nr:hypothetical protein [Paraburkholderia azotifigens]